MNRLVCKSAAIDFLTNQKSQGHVAAHAIIGAFSGNKSEAAPAAPAPAAPVMQVSAVALKLGFF